MKRKAQRYEAKNGTTVEILDRVISSVDVNGELVGYREHNFDLRMVEIDEIQETPFEVILIFTNGHALYVYI